MAINCVVHALRSSFRLRKCIWGAPSLGIPGNGEQGALFARSQADPFTQALPQGQRFRLARPRSGIALQKRLA